MSGISRPIDGCVSNTGKINPHISSFSASLVFDRHLRVCPPKKGAVFDGVKAKIMGQQLEIEEKSRTLTLLKKELKRAKEACKEIALER